MKWQMIYFKIYNMVLGRLRNKSASSHIIYHDSTIASQAWNKQHPYKARSPSCSKPRRCPRRSPSWVPACRPTCFCSRRACCPMARPTRPTSATPCTRRSARRCGRATHGRAAIARAQPADATWRAIDQLAHVHLARVGGGRQLLHERVDVLHLRRHVLEPRVQQVN